MFQSCLESENNSLESFRNSIYCGVYLQIFWVFNQFLNKDEEVRLRGHVKRRDKRGVSQGKKDAGDRCIRQKEGRT